MACGFAIANAGIEPRDRMRRWEPEPRRTPRPVASRLLRWKLIDPATRRNVMATAKKNDLTAAIGRMKRESERLVDRLQRDVGTFARRAKSELTSDLKALEKNLRSSATTAIRDIEGRGKRALSAVDGRLGELEARLLERLDAASKRELRALEQRVEALERRNAELEMRLADAVSTD
jgi:DNA anti-recombination protein RmuC